MSMGGGAGASPPSATSGISFRSSAPSPPSAAAGPPGCAFLGFDFFAGIAILLWVGLRIIRTKFATTRPKADHPGVECLLWLGAVWRLWPQPDYAAACRRRSGSA